VNQIARIFNETFAPWNITLPADALENRRRGMIQSAGWIIHYLFGTDEQGEYMDYYTAHRMTNDRHIRIYAGGTVKELEAPLEFTVYPADCTPEEKARIDKEYFETNRRIYAELKKKWFV